MIASVRKHESHLLFRSTIWIPKKQALKPTVFLSHVMMMVDVEPGRSVKLCSDPP